MSYIVPREKPKKCMNCPFIDKITYDCKLMYGNDYPDFYIQYENCPLIEIPNPHGRLIDADKLMHDINEYHVSDGKFQHWVDVQFTVIEAEGSKNE